MRLQEMMQDVQQQQDLLLITLDELGLANVVDDYIPNSFAQAQSQRFGEDARAQRLRAPLLELNHIIQRNLLA
jgi:hypothetical protein